MEEKRRGATIEALEDYKNSLILQRMADSTISGRMMVMRVVYDLADKLVDKRDFCDLTIGDIKTIVYHYGEDKKPRTVNEMLSRVRLFADYLLMDGFSIEYDISLIKNLALKNRYKTRRREVTREMRTNLIKMAKGDSLYHSAIVHILIYSGMRVGDLVKLRLDDFVPGLDNTSHLRVVEEKTGNFTSKLLAKEATIAVLDWLKVHKYNSGRDFIFVNPKTNQPIVRFAVTDLLKKYSRWMKLGWNIGPHDLRYAYITEAARSGMALTDIQALTGHKSLQTVMSYIIPHNRALMEKYLSLDLA